MAKPENLVDTLALERIEVNLFRGHAPKDQGPRIFGGLVIAQALLAAYGTVEKSLCHSIHCYFLRPGDPAIPILYEVDRARDGRSFTSRRVTAIQHGEQIFNLAGSFQHPEQGLEHQDPMPDVPSPDSLADESELRRSMTEKLPPLMRQMADRPRPIELRPLDPHHFMATAPAPPTQNVWMRASAPIGDDPIFNQAVLAYASDMSFLSTSMRPHGVSWQTGGLQTASIDHALWFHRPANFNDWHLFAQKSPSASGSRGFNLGEIYSQDGILVASAAQEGLMRYRPPGVDV
ncbi:MAG TPA: acyl-CoA thioesterase II [Caulobacteraceae bacterium]|jgi:acyl-CoA thioesterase-2|nr:acyl-CoA thioesterase II [Caulobacteraceae bacterium]